MRMRIGPLAGAALILLAGGCAGPRLCQVIPMQIQMASYDRDQMQSLVDAKQAEVNRTKENLDLARTRLDQMKQERDDLRRAVGFTYGGTLLAGSGVGASAASCVSLARALNTEFGLGLPIEEINRVAWQGEFPYHGVASGVDNTASTYGGLLLFQLIKGQQHFERIRTPRPFEIVLANSGITANTALLDEVTEKQKKADPQLFASRLKTITAQAHEMKKALEAGDLRTVGKIMSENHKILMDMDFSHEKLDYLCKLALDKGAWGAKVTGGGRGGYMVSLTPRKELQETVAAAFEKEGFKTIRATIGGS